VSVSGKYAIAGVGESDVGQKLGRSGMSLQLQAITRAITDSGLEKSAIDGVLGRASGGLAPNFSAVLAERLGIKPTYTSDVALSGASSASMVLAAVAALEAGYCTTVLCVNGDAQTGRTERGGGPKSWIEDFERPFGFIGAPVSYALPAQRHMYEYGTTSEQLAWIKVAASHHAQHNPNAMLREVVTVEDVVNSPVIADPLHRLDCCVISDGGGALIVTGPEIAKSLKHPPVKVIGTGYSPKHQMGGRIDLTYCGARWSGPRAFGEAGITPNDIKYASIYDSFTVTVLITLEDLGFCEKGKGGAFVADGNLISGVGKLPFNTDGGGLCNNHPSNRGGMTKIIEAVRQLRGIAHPKVQVANCDLALAHGTGGALGTRHGSATLILERE
jgi:acetyl-CoA C-acetyltransferase